MLSLKRVDSAVSGGCFDKLHSCRCKANFCRQRLVSLRNSSLRERSNALQKQGLQCLLCRERHWLSRLDRPLVDNVTDWRHLRFLSQPIFVRLSRRARGPSIDCPWGIRFILRLCILLSTSFDTNRSVLSLAFGHLADSPRPVKRSPPLQIRNDWDSRARALCFLLTSSSRSTQRREYRTMGDTGQRRSAK